MAGQHGFTYDHSLLMKDAGVIGASAAAQVGGADKVLDVGAARFDGTAVIDTTAVEVDTGDELYQIEVQGGDAVGFGGVVVCLATLKLGDSSKNGGSADSPAAGHYELPFTNVFNGVTFPFIRLYSRISGTIATGINYTGYLGKTMAN